MSVWGSSPWCERCVLAMGARGALVDSRGSPGDRGRRAAPAVGHRQPVLLLLRRRHAVGTRKIALKANEVRLPDTWEGIEQQNELLRAMRAAPPGSPPEGSTGDIIQKAANAITVKDYRPSRRA